MLGGPCFACATTASRSASACSPRRRSARASARRRSQVTRHSTPAPTRSIAFSHDTPKNSEQPDREQRDQQQRCAVEAERLREARADEIAQRPAGGLRQRHGQAVEAQRFERGAGQQHQPEAEDAKRQRMVGAGVGTPDAAVAGDDQHDAGDDPPPGGKAEQEIQQEIGEPGAGDPAPVRRSARRCPNTTSPDPSGCTSRGSARARGTPPPPGATRTPAPGGRNGGKGARFRAARRRRRSAECGRGSGSSFLLKNITSPPSTSGDAVCTRERSMRRQGAGADAGRVASPERVPISITIDGPTASVSAGSCERTSARRAGSMSPTTCPQPWASFRRSRPTDR